MALDLEEQEQLDALKQFWKQYGALIITLAFLVLASFAGVKGWNYYQRGQSEQASALFGKLEEAVRKNDVAQIGSLGAEIIDKYGSTAYGPMAALLLARTGYDSGDTAAAATRLQWAVDKARDDETAALARLRLAGIRLDEKKYDEALALLDAKHANAFAPLYADLRGDVLAAQGKLAEARAAYKLALEKSLPNSNYRNVVQIKLDALGPAK
ncbi:MAG TPA: tetratricopeptide repeat protein [Burkholderiales bacterium]|jgi:predicted negative regulator of RcsB-dependent stress response|nr:tetratricopeptide repeat protein [Burkholderiales bacterium]